MVDFSFLIKNSYQIVGPDKGTSILKTRLSKATKNYDSTGGMFLFFDKWSINYFRLSSHIDH